MGITLQNIAEVKFGAAGKTSDSGQIPCLQVSNLTSGGQIDEEQFVYLAEIQDVSGGLLESGDLVMPAKGRSHYSVLIPQKYDSGAVASSSLFIIRITETGILPEYLQWFLNLPRTQWELDKGATGTNISSLSIRHLRNLKIEVPKLDTQKKIVNLKSLQEKEAILMRKLSEARLKLVESVAKKLINR